MDFNAAKVAKEQKRKTQLIRRTTWKRSRSRLDRLTYEILALRDEGLSIAEIQRWLQKEKRIKVHRTTVSRWVEKKKREHG